MRWLSHVFVDTQVEAEQREAEPEQAELPIGHYVDDRKVMLQHVFASVPRCQIQAMLPPVLKVPNFYLLIY